MLLIICRFLLGLHTRTAVARSPLRQLGFLVLTITRWFPNRHIPIMKPSLPSVTPPSLSLPYIYSALSSYDYH